MFQLFSSLNLDAVQILLWSTTYVLIIVAGFQSFSARQSSIPPLVCTNNLAWELCALIHSGGFWGHVLWFSLDVPIFVFCMRSIKQRRHRLLFFVLLAAEAILFYCLFKAPQGMLYSSFAIDLIMAISFLFYVDKLSPKLQIPIAVLKLLGDAAAGIYYGKNDMIVAVTAVIVLVCNSVYLHMCIERRQKLIVQAKSRHFPKEKRKRAK